MTTRKPLIPDLFFLVSMKHKKYLFLIAKNQFKKKSQMANLTLRNVCCVE